MKILVKAAFSRAIIDEPSFINLGPGARAGAGTKGPGSTYDTPHHWPRLVRSPPGPRATRYTTRETAQRFGKKQRGRLYVLRTAQHLIYQSCLSYSLLSCQFSWAPIELGTDLAIDIRHMCGRVPWQWVAVAVYTNALRRHASFRSTPPLKDPEQQAVQDLP